MRAALAATPRCRWTPQQRTFGTIKAAFRSGLEEIAADHIRAAGLPVNYEAFRIPFVEPAKSRTYRPDFILPNGIVIETKGLFQTDDRQKHKLIKALYPDLDIRLVYSNANARIAKGSPTTYATWATAAGIPWAHRVIPPAWLKEAPNRASLAVLRELGYGS